MTYEIDYAARKAKGVLSCPEDPEYTTEAVVGTLTQEKLDALILEVRNDDTEWGDEELRAAGVEDVTEEGFGVIAPLSK